MSSLAEIMTKIFFDALERTAAEDLRSLPILELSSRLHIRITSDNTTVIDIRFTVIAYTNGYSLYLSTRRSSTKRSLYLPERRSVNRFRAVPIVQCAYCVPYNRCVLEVMGQSILCWHFLGCRGEHILKCTAMLCWPFLDYRGEHESGGRYCNYEEFVMRRKIAQESSTTIFAVVELWKFEILFSLSEKHVLKLVTTIEVQRDLYDATELPISQLAPPIEIYRANWDLPRIEIYRTNSKPQND